MSNPGSSLAKALVKFQHEVPTIAKNAVNPHFRSKFANLEGVIDAIQETLFKCGLAVIHRMGVEGHRNVMTTILFHESGESIESSMILPDIADPQKLGAAMTYFRRYALMATLGVAPSEDDDGNSISPRPQPAPQQAQPPRPAQDTRKPSDRQLSYLKMLAEKAGQPMPTVLTMAEVDAAIKKLSAR